MKTKLITAVVIVLFASLAIYSYTTQQNKLELQKVEIKSRETKIKALDLKYKKLNTELDKLKSDKDASDEQVKKLEQQRQKLEKEKQDLHQKLQAKLESKSKLAQASQSVVNTVTQTKTVSAAPVSGNIQQIIIDAANRYGVDPNRALRIAKCESGFNPNAVNYGYNENGYPSGLFQHISGYWGARAAKYGYAGASVFDPVANANVTMGMWRDGQAGLWECR